MANPSTADIRKFLTEFFSDEELATFCFDHFRDVYEQFAAGMAKGQKVQLLLERCIRRETLPELLAVLERERPEQYWQHLGTPQTEARIESAPTRLGVETEDQEPSQPTAAPIPKGPSIKPEGIHVPPLAWGALAVFLVVAGVVLGPSIIRAVVPSPTVSPTPNLGIGSTQVSDKDGMVMVYVPADEFLMGSTDADTEASPDEKPQHRVYLDAFWIDRTEVTKAQYQRCVASGICASASCSGTGMGDHPVVCVRWQDASKYCVWAERRLPTEAEWEKAARGTEGRRYPWGNDAPDCNRVNYSGKDDACVGNTRAVGSYPSGASAYGALDMAGNVWEWVADRYSETYYANSPAANPQGPDSGLLRVLRGGSWAYYRGGVRAAVRHWGLPVGSLADIGFRCVRSP
jgi:formylglycine-generating enzyme required for sulfatase activity